MSSWKQGPGHRSTWGSGLKLHLREGTGVAPCVSGFHDGTPRDPGGFAVSDALLDYYQRELAFIRQLGTEFAQQYPKIAGRIRLGPDRIDDPLGCASGRIVCSDEREFARSSTTTSPSWPRQCLASCTRIISRRFHRWRLFSSYPIRRRGSKRLATRFHGVSSWRVTRNWRSLTANHAAFDLLPDQSMAYPYPAGGAPFSAFPGSHGREVVGGVLGAPYRAGMPGCRD